MIDDAIDSLARVGRMLAAGQQGLAILAEIQPEYVRGANFVYGQIAMAIQNETDWIKGQRAARNKAEGNAP